MSYIMYHVSDIINIYIISYHIKSYHIITHLSCIYEDVFYHSSKQTAASGAAALCPPWCSHLVPSPPATKIHRRDQKVIKTKPMCFPMWFPVWFLLVPCFHLVHWKSFGTKWEARICPSHAGSANGSLLPESSEASSNQQLGPVSSHSGPPLSAKIRRPLPSLGLGLGGALGPRQVCNRANPFCNSTRCKATNRASVLQVWRQWPRILNQNFSSFGKTWTYDPCHPLQNPVPLPALCEDLLLGELILRHVDMLPAGPRTANRCTNENVYSMVLLWEPNVMSAPPTPPPKPQNPWKQKHCKTQYEMHALPSLRTLSRRRREQQGHTFFNYSTLSAECAGPAQLETKVLRAGERTMHGSRWSTIRWSATTITAWIRVEYTHPGKSVQRPFGTWILLVRRAFGKSKKSVQKYPNPIGAPHVKQCWFQLFFSSFTCRSYWYAAYQAVDFLFLDL